MWEKVSSLKIIFIVFPRSCLNITSLLLCKLCSRCPPPPPGCTFAGYLHNFIACLFQKTVGISPYPPPQPLVLDCGFKPNILLLRIYTTGSRDGCLWFYDWTYLWSLSFGGFCSGTINRSHSKLCTVFVQGFLS